MTDRHFTRWLCCHLGAREHYAVPRALHRQQRLGQMITDAWVKPGSLLSSIPGDLPRRLSERFHHELADADVRHFTSSLMAREAVWRLQGPGGWRQLMARNQWFGHRAAAALGLADRANGPRTMVFAHSYSAREAFAYAKSRGWTTVLGQIDPGERHFRLVEQLSQSHAEYGAPPVMPPPAYFSGWREECALADWIVVNSEWARDAVHGMGIPMAKLRVIPLAYEPEIPDAAPVREYPDTFTSARPLRALFVGHVAVTKGVPELLEAVAQLADLPVVLRLVGETAMVVPPRFRDHSSMQFVGPVSRSEVMRHYHESDVLVFPSHSDGFGMAQVEAQAYRLPIIASRHCGQVVADGVNGILLPAVTPGDIATALRRILEAPALLSAFSRAASSGRSRSAELSTALLGLEPQ